MRSWTDRPARLPVLALAVLCVGLAAHNLAMAELWDAGVRGGALDVVAAWKEALLALALAAALWHRRNDLVAQGHKRMPDLVALAYVAFVVAYALLPQGWLDGEASAHTRLLALRHDLLPVGGYALGRLLVLHRGDARLLRWALLATAAGIALLGIVDVYAVSLQWWRESGAPGWFREQLGLDYDGLSGLPENFVYNPGDERPLRRLVSTFLSPLATSYLLVVALLLLAARRRVEWWAGALAVLLLAALLLTHTRAAILALAGGLVVLALAQRRSAPAVLAAAVVVLGVTGVGLYDRFAPETRFTPAELEIQRANAAEEPGATGDAFSAGESSLSSHWTNLRDGLDTVVHHPQGFGLGNAGVTAKRSGTRPRAGESTYTELGAEIGLLGALAFVGWNLALLRELWRRSAWLAASLAAVLALGLQTDVIGVHWLAVVLWGLCGAAVGQEYDHAS